MYHARFHLSFSSCFLILYSCLFFTLQIAPVSCISAGTGCENFSSPSIIPWNSTTNYGAGDERNPKWAPVGFDPANIIRTCKEFEPLITSINISYNFFLNIICAKMKCSCLVRDARHWRKCSRAYIIFILVNSTANYLHLKCEYDTLVNKTICANLLIFNSQTLGPFFELSMDIEFASGMENFTKTRCIATA